MSTKVSFRVLCVFALIVVLAAACGGGKPIKEQIIGKWEGEFEGSVATMEFTTDGKLIVTGSIQGQEFSIEGVYTFTDDDTVEISFPEMSDQKTTGDVKISGDSLTITDPADGATDTLTRVK